MNNQTPGGAGQYYPRTPVQQPNPRGGVPNGTPAPGSGLPNGGDNSSGIVGPGNQPPASGSGNSSQFPWLNAWNGPFAAPTSPYENQALQGMGNFAQGGFGLNGAQDYYNKELSGSYLSGNDPNFQKIEDSGKILKDQQDAQALKELQSRAAAGGNALSGALMGQEQQYQQGSNAAFDNMMAQLRAANYTNERGLQQGAASGLQNLSNAQTSGWGNLMAMGAIPRNVANQEIQGQYGDFLRQGNAFRDQYQYPDQLALATLNHGYPGSHQVGFGQSDMQNLLALLSQGGSNGSDILSQLSGLFSGGGTDSGGQDTSGAQDGIPMSAYDGNPNPTAMPDYNSMLTQEQAQQKAQQADLGKASNASKGMSILALLMQVLGLGTNKKQSSSKGGGGGGGNQAAPGSKQTAPGGANWWNPNEHVGQSAPANSLVSDNGQKYSTDKSGTAHPLNPDLSSPESQQIGAAMAAADPNHGLDQNPLADSSSGGADPFSTPSSPYYQDPYLDPSNFAGNPNDSYNDPGTSYYQDPLFDPSNFAGGDSGGGDYSDSSGGA